MLQDHRFFRGARELTLAVTVGFLVAAMSLVISPQFVIMIIAVMVAAVLLLNHPELLLLGAIVAVATIYDDKNSPQIPLGIGGFDLKIIDALFLFLYAKLILNWVIARNNRQEVHWVRSPLDIVLLLFFVVSLFSTAYWVLRGTIQFRDEANPEIRQIAYYLFFYLVTNLIVEHRQVDRLVIGFHLLSTVVSVLILLQYMLGTSMQVLPGRVEALNTAGVVNASITRILPPGMAIVLVSFLCQGVYLFLAPARLRNVLIVVSLLLTGAAVILTFNRNFWAIIAMSMLYLFVLTGSTIRTKMLRLGLALFPIAFVSFILLTTDRPLTSAPSLFDATIERFGTLASFDVLEEDSLNFRYIENRYAFQHLNPPLPFGHGLGYRYRVWDVRLDWLDTDGTVYDMRDYIHNGHFWLLMKTGFVGYGLFMAFIIGVIVRGLFYWHRASTPHLKSFMLGSALICLGQIPATIVNPTYMQTFWILVYVVVAGINEVVIRQIQLQENSVSRDKTTA